MLLTSLIVVVATGSCSSDDAQQPCQPLAATVLNGGATEEQLARAMAAHELTEEEIKDVAAFWAFLVIGVQDDEIQPEFFVAELPERMLEIAGQYPSAFTVPASDDGACTPAPAAASADPLMAPPDLEPLTHAGAGFGACPCGVSCAPSGLAIASLVTRFIGVVGGRFIDSIPAPARARMQQLIDDVRGLSNSVTVANGVSAAVRQNLTVSDALSILGAVVTAAGWGALAVGASEATMLFIATSGTGLTLAAIVYEVWQISGQVSHCVQCQRVYCCDENGERNGLETDRDCGGGICPPCTDYKTCLLNSDCVSNQCDLASHKCISCNDVTKNGLETGSDCGGAICVAQGKACALLQDCNVNADCQSAHCGTSNVCVDCNNDWKDGAESDEDCGGPDCPACEDGNMCNAPLDCISGQCVLNECISCFDDAQNGSETDYNCGGDCALKCPNGWNCAIPGDCESNFCNVDGVCHTCGDGVKNDAETDRDCGGPECQKCEDGQTCLTSSDCEGYACDGGICISCNDGVKNGAEVFVDCGGPDCPGPCCNEDGVMNGDETDVDCGGEGCPRCNFGQFCNLDDDCVTEWDPDLGAYSGNCEGGLCTRQRLRCEAMSLDSTLPWGPMQIITRNTWWDWFVDMGFFDPDVYTFGNFCGPSLELEYTPDVGIYCSCEPSCLDSGNCCVDACSWCGFC